MRADAGRAGVLVSHTCVPIHTLCKGVTSSFQLGVPITIGNTTAIFELNISSVILTGTRSGNTLSNVVLGGYMTDASFDAAFESILPLLGGIELVDILPILENLYDVPVGGMCQGFSVGLLASGTQLM